MEDLLELLVDHEVSPVALLRIDGRGGIVDDGPEQFLAAVKRVLSAFAIGDALQRASHA